MCVSTWRLHKDALVNVYCPFAVNRFFSAVVRGSKPRFESYWMKSSGAKYALTSYLHDYPLSSQLIMELSDQRLEMSNDSLRAGYLLQDVTFEQILVIGGYFSIKAITDDTAQEECSADRDYRCGITNQDVRNVFFPVLMSYLVSFKNTDGSDLSTAIGQVKSALRQGDIAQLCRSFNEILGYVRDDLFKALASHDQGVAQTPYQVPKPILRLFTARCSSLRSAHLLSSSRMRWQITFGAVIWKLLPRIRSTSLRSSDWRALPRHPLTSV